MTPVPASSPVSGVTTAARLRSKRTGAWQPPELDLDAPPDLSRPFVCPTSTPLYHAPSYALLGEQQALRYNQLTALSFHELHSLFETEVADRLFPALRERVQLPADLHACLERLATEEAHHHAVWQRLDAWLAPDLYQDGPFYFLSVGPLQRWLMELACRRPDWLTVVPWLVLAMEELACELASRALRPGLDIEPRLHEVYRMHLRDEIWHVQVNAELVRTLHARRGACARRLSATLLRHVIARFFLTPTRAARRVVSRLVQEFPDLRPHEPRLVADLRGLRHNAGYQQALYSPASHPLTFALFGEFPEFRGMAKVVSGYRPEVNAHRIAVTERGDAP